MQKNPTLEFRGFNGFLTLTVGTPDNKRVVGPLMFDPSKDPAHFAGELESLADLLRRLSEEFKDTPSAKITLSAT